MKKHFVTFYSPGTFVHEETTKPIAEWDTDLAMEMSKDITERHDSRPFCFVFSTRERGSEVLDSSEIKRSGRYYLGGTVETLEEVKRRATGDDRILISNMECNKWDRIITTETPWKMSQPLESDDVVLEIGVQE